MKIGAGDMNDTLREGGDEAVRARFAQREKYHRPDGDDVDQSYAGDETFSHIWRSKDHDYPCRPTSEEWPNGVFGRIYVKVITPDGTEHVIPKDELVEKQQSQPRPEGPRPLMRELPPADPFPIKALGDVLGDAALAIHDRIQAPHAICGQSVLATAMLAVQGHVDVRLPTGQTRPLSEYFVTVAQSGERKTSVDREATAAISKYEADLRENIDTEPAVMRTESLRGTRPAMPRSKD
jgi:hypothetical protein